jgi:hypothetical protein
VIDNDVEFDDGGEFDHFVPLDGEEHPEDHIGHHFSWQPPEDEREDGGSVQGEADDWRDTGTALSPVRSPPPQKETAAAAAKREAETAKRRAADAAARAARATVEIEAAYQEEVRAGAKKALKSLRSGPGGMEDAENMVLFGQLPPTVSLPECGGGSLLHALLQAPWAAAAASAGVGVGVADDGAGTLTHAIHSLLGIGVPSAQRDAKGRTAAQFAAEMGYYDAAWMLEDAEEKEPAGTTKRLLELTAGEAE